MEIIKFSDFLERKKKDDNEYNFTLIALIIAVIVATLEVGIGIYRSF